MLIGEDYPKIEFQWFGFELLEPMAFITDMLLAILAFTLAWKVKSIGTQHQLYKNWYRFYLVMGIATITGGFAHLMYNYWGIAGKFPSWIFAPIAIFFLESASISVHPNSNTKSLLTKISIVKYFVVVAIWLLICFSVDLGLDINEKKPFTPLAINSAIGAICCSVILTWYYGRILHPAYKLFTYGTLIAVPSVFLVVIRIHPHRWFNGEDLGHVLMMTTYVFSFIALKRLQPTLVQVSK